MIYAIWKYPWLLDREKTIDECLGYQIWLATV